MKIPTSDQLLVYILETTLAIHHLQLADLPAAVSSLEYKLKGDVTLFVSMYGTNEIGPYWTCIAENCIVLYDLREQPLSLMQLDPAAKLAELRAKLPRRDK